VRSRRPNTDPVTKKELDELYDKMGETAIIQAQNEYLQLTGDSETELDMVTSSNIYTKADGIKVAKLEGMEARVVDISTFNAFAPTYHLKALQQVAKKSGLSILAMGSEIYALVKSISQPQKRLE
jgi:hypothetical protein